MNRRPATLAATAIHATTHQPEAKEDGLSAEFRKLIDSHKNLSIVSDMSALHHSKLEDEWRQNRPENTITIGQSRKHTIDPIQSNHCAMEIIQHSHIMGVPVSHMSSSKADIKKANVKRRDAKASDIKAYREAIRQERFNREADGVEQAWRDCQRTFKDEREAFLAIMRYPCKTSADHHAKAELLKCESDEFGIDDPVIEALTYGMLAA